MKGRSYRRRMRRPRARSPAALGPSVFRLPYSLPLGYEMSKSLIDVTDAVFGYGGRPVVAVDRLELSRGQCLGIFGPNGSGKTTLVRGITGLLSPMAGRV